MTRRPLVALAALLAVCLAAVGLAQAATLPVTSSLTPFEPATRCTMQPVTVEPGEVRGGTASAVVVTVPDDCADASGRLHLVGVDGRSDVDFTASAGTTAVQTGTFPAGAVTAVALVLDGWAVPTTWTYEAAPAGPVYPGNDRTVVSDLTWTLPSKNPIQACFTVDVTTDSPTPVEWRVEVDLSRPPFNGQTEGYGFVGDQAYLYELHAATPSSGFLQIGGNQWNGARTITADRTLELTVCNYGLPPGIDTPSAYDVTVEPSTWTDTLACLRTTVTGNGTSEFYVGWSVTLDLQPAVDRITSAGRTFGWYEYGEDEWMLRRTADPGAGPHVQTVSSTAPVNVKDTESVTFESCVTGY